MPALKHSQVLVHQAYRSFMTQTKTIIAMGRNFSEHAQELGHEQPKQPFYFLKPPSSLIASGGIIELPSQAIVHHEVELGVVLAREGKNVNVRDWKKYIAGYCLCIDVTARNLQQEAAKAGLPWAMAKGFDTFTPVGPLIDKDRVMDPSALTLQLKINGQIRQLGHLKQMTIQIPEIVEFISSKMTLSPFDLILTGTPSGVGQLLDGDKVDCHLFEQDSLLSQTEYSVRAA